MKPFIFLLILFATSVQAQEPQAETASTASTTDYLRYHPFSARLGLGSTIGPETFLVVGSVEGHLDRFLSLGPMIQIGKGSSRDLFIFTGGGRLTWPLFGLSRELERAEVSIQGGVGLVHRTVNDFNFNDFVFETGLNVDVFLFDHMTVGIGGLVNITSSREETVIGSLFASATYRL